jgi:oxygen-independent coproporphyrinogen-3 oxidase
LPESAWPAPRAAYVHVPFCVHRCGYCNFTVVAGRDDLITAYLDALDTELYALGSPREVDTLFLGGGTPTHLPPESLWRLLATVRHWFPLADGYEFSIEANPADLDAARVEVLAEFGVTRLSLGVQSFRPQKLRLLERDHGPEEIARSFQLARRHVASVSLDLIFGCPGETLADWQSDLQAAINAVQETRRISEGAPQEDRRVSEGKPGTGFVNCRAINAQSPSLTRRATILGEPSVPDHVSTYGLTFERGTTFWNRLQHGALARLDEETERMMYAQAIDLLTAAGLEHYEVSNFARPGHRCRHNEVYWAGASYYAAGPGASRYVNGRRETNHRSATTYLRRVLSGQSPVAEWEELSPEDRAREALVLGLRRIAGINLAEFTDRTGYDALALGGPALQRHLEWGLLELASSCSPSSLEPKDDAMGSGPVSDPQFLRLTREGLFVSDSLWPSYLRA